MQSEKVFLSSKRKHSMQLCICINCMDFTALYKFVNCLTVTAAETMKHQNDQAVDTTDHAESLTLARAQQTAVTITTLDFHSTHLSYSTLS